MRYNKIPESIPAIAITVLMFGCSVNAVSQVPANKSQNWKSYASDKASSKYSPLDQVNATNFSDLTIAWKWERRTKK